MAETRNPPYDFAVVDEAQDFGIAHLRFLAALGGDQANARPDALFFAGDLGQRIFQQPFSWRVLGVDTSNEFGVMLREKHHFIVAILEGPKIWLAGDDRTLDEFRHQQPRKPRALRSARR